MEAVVDDVLGRLKGYVEHVFPAGPAGRDAVGRVGRAVVADQARPGLLDDFLAERNRELAADSIPRERDASVPETHDRSSQRPLVQPRRRVGDPASVQSRSLLDRAAHKPLSSTVRPRAVETLPFGDVLPIR